MSEMKAASRGSGAASCEYNLERLNCARDFFGDPVKCHKGCYLSGQSKAYVLRLFGG
jgi:hypothetical protein